LRQVTQVVFHDVRNIYNVIVVNVREKSDRRSEDKHYRAQKPYLPDIDVTICLFEF